MNTISISEKVTVDLNKAAVLAREIIGEVVVELSRLPNKELILDVTCSGEVISITRHRDISDFQAGRLFEAEVAHYRGLVK